jgi:hypothetical protein
MFNTSNCYSGGYGFEFGPEDLLSRPKFIMVFLSPSRKYSHSNITQILSSVYFSLSLKHRSRDSSVSIVIGYGLRFPAAQFQFSTALRPNLGPTQPPILWVPVFFLGVKAAGA